MGKSEGEARDKSGRVKRGVASFVSVVGLMRSGGIEPSLIGCGVKRLDVMSLIAKKSAKLGAATFLRQTYFRRTIFRRTVLIK